MKISHLTLLTCLLTACYIGEELPPDQQIWDYAEPREVGMNQEILLEVDRSIKLRRFEEVQGLIIIKDDKLIFENYYSSIERQTLLALGQSSIVFTAAAIGIAQEKGLLSLDDPIVQFLPSYQQLFDADTLKRSITIEHLLTHRSGFSWNEQVTRRFQNPENDINRMISSNDWINFILSKPLEAGPGLRYNFNSGTGIILAKIVANASGASFSDFLRENIFQGIGIGDFDVASDPSGNEDGALGISMSLIDWTNFGYLMLQNGIRNGRRVIDPNYVDTSTSVQVMVSTLFDFGYGWRIFGTAYENIFPFPVDQSFYVEGENGQNQYVVRSDDLIVSIYAENVFRSGNPSLNLFFEITRAIP